MITTDLSEPFQMFGESDEVYRIKGGSSALINALVAALENKIEMKQGYALTALDHKGGKIVTSFDAPGGGTKSESFESVILALPFTKLRQVKGLEGLELGADKLKCIRELGYGTSAKIMNGTTSRVWRSPDSGLPAPSNGDFFSDLGFQNFYETSRAQPGDAGILTNFLGVKVAKLTRSRRSTPSAPAWPRCRRRLPKVSTRRRSISWFWSVYPFTLGSYASAKVGQYTTMLEVAPEPALDGRLQFAGEHTCSDFLGYMNGGVVSGNRASAALIEIMALQKK